MPFEVVNLYELIPKEKDDISDFPNKDELQIDLPFRMLVVGGSGSYKTTFVLNLIPEIGVFRKIFIISKDIDEKLYKYFKQQMEPIEKKFKKQILFTSDRIEDLPPIDSFDGKYNSLVIIDDHIQTSGKELEPVRELFLRGRKRQISSIFITQRYFKTDLMIRSNSNIIALKRIESAMDLSRIQREYNLGVNKKELQRMYEFVRKTDPKASFLIDMQTVDDRLKYRMNFQSIFDFCKPIGSNPKDSLNSEKEF